MLQYPGVRSRKFYRFEGENINKAKALNRHVMELVGLRSFENLNKTDVIWCSTEAALRSIVEGMSWMHWWTSVMKSLSPKSTNEARLVCCLSLAGARCQLLVVKMALNLWANFVLKRHDVVLAKVKDSVIRVLYGSQGREVIFMLRTIPS